MRTSRSIFALVALSLTLTSSALLADDDKPKKDGDALEIMKRVDAATKAVKGVAYSAEVFFKGLSPGQRGFRANGRVRAQDNPGNVQLKLNIKGELTGRSPFHVITDGDKLVSLNAKTKVAITGSAKAASRLLGVPSVIMMGEFLHPTPFSDELGGHRRVYEGAKKVEGVDCHVVFIEYQKNGPRSRWYVGKEDYLPRRVDRIISKADAKVERSRVLVVKGLEVVKKFPEGTFDPKIPEGYKIQEYKAPPERASLLAVGTEAPDWTLPTAEGKKISLKSLRGNVVVLDFWATWCGPCKRAMPGVQKLHEHYKGKPVKIYGLNCWERGDAVKYMADQGFTYGLLLKGDDVAKEYKVSGIPTFYVIGPDGKIVHRASGFNPDLEARLARIIEGALPKNDKGKKPEPKKDPVVEREA